MLQTIVCMGIICIGSHLHSAALEHSDILPRQFFDALVNDNFSVSRQFILQDLQLLASGCPEKAFFSYPEISVKEFERPNNLLLSLCEELKKEDPDETTRKIFFVHALNVLFYGRQRLWHLAANSEAIDTFLGRLFKNMFENNNNDTLFNMIEMTDLFFRGFDTFPLKIAPPEILPPAVRALQSSRNFHVFSSIISSFKVDGDLVGDRVKLLVVKWFIEAASLTKSDENRKLAVAQRLFKMLALKSCWQAIPLDFQFRKIRVEITQFANKFLKCITDEDLRNTLKNYAISELETIENKWPEITELQ